MRDKAYGRPSAVPCLMLLHIVLRRSRQRGPVSAPSGPPSPPRALIQACPCPACRPIPAWRLVSSCLPYVTKCVSTTATTCSTDCYAESSWQHSTEYCAPPCKLESEALCCCRSLPHKRPKPACFTLGAQTWSPVVPHTLHVQMHTNQKAHWKGLCAPPLCVDQARHLLAGIDPNISSHPAPTAAGQHQPGSLPPAAAHLPGVRGPDAAPSCAEAVPEALHQRLAD